MEENKLPILIREFIPLKDNMPVFFADEKETTLVILQILSDHFKGFSNPNKIVGKKTSYRFGDPVGIIIESTEASELEKNWNEGGKPLAYYSDEFHSFKII